MFVEIHVTLFTNMYLNKTLNELILKIWNRNNSLNGLKICRKCSTKRKPIIEPIKGSVEIFNKTYICDDWTNITPKVVSFIGRNLYLKNGNPIYLISEGIRHYFKDFDVFYFDSPVVDLNANFDSLLIAKDHVSRSKSDTYYVNKDYVLRSHTSAHQNHCLQKNSTAFVCIADVYRRDEINSTHSAAFHQCEAFRLYSQDSHQVLHLIITSFHY